MSDKYQGEKKKSRVRRFRNAGRLEGWPYIYIYQIEETFVSKKETFEQRSEGSEGVNPTTAWGRAFLAKKTVRENS